MLASVLYDLVTTFCTDSTPFVAYALCSVCLINRLPSVNLITQICLPQKMTLYTLRKYNLIELDLAYKMAIFDSTMQLGGTSLCACSYLEHRCLLYFFPLLINLFSSVPLHDTLLTIFFLKLLFTIPRIFIISKLSVLQFFS